MIFLGSELGTLTTVLWCHPFATLTGILFWGVISQPCSCPCFCFWPLFSPSLYGCVKFAFKADKTLMNKRLLVSSIVILSHEKYIAYTGRGDICEYRISSKIIWHHQQPFLTWTGFWHWSNDIDGHSLPWVASSDIDQWGPSQFWWFVHLGTCSTHPYMVLQIFTQPKPVKTFPYPLKSFGQAKMSCQWGIVQRVQHLWSQLGKHNCWCVSWPDLSSSHRLKIKTCL